MRAHPSFGMTTTKTLRSVFSWRASYTIVSPKMLLPIHPEWHSPPTEDLLTWKGVMLNVKHTILWNLENETTCLNETPSKIRPHLLYCFPIQVRVFHHSYQNYVLLARILNTTHSINPTGTSMEGAGTGRKKTQLPAEEIPAFTWRPSVLQIHKWEIWEMSRPLSLSKTKKNEGNIFFHTYFSPKTNKNCHSFI